jgi:hypothetical protein
VMATHKMGPDRAWSRPGPVRVIKQ